MKSKFGTPNAQQLGENLSLVEFCKNYSDRTMLHRDLQHEKQVWYT